MLLHLHSGHQGATGPKKVISCCTTPTCITLASTVFFVGDHVTSYNMGVLLLDKSGSWGVLVIGVIVWPGAVWCFLLQTVSIKSQQMQ